MQTNPWECDNCQFPCSYFYSPRPNRFSAPGFVCRQRARTIGTGAIKCPDYHSFTPSRWETPSLPFWRGIKIWNPLDQALKALFGKFLHFFFWIFNLSLFLDLEFCMIPKRYSFYTCVKNLDWSYRQVSDREGESRAFCAPNNVKTFKYK